MPTNTLTEPSYTRCINHCNASLPSCQFETMIIGPPIPPHKCPHKWHMQYTILWISCSQSQCLETHDLWLLSTYNKKRKINNEYNHQWPMVFMRHLQPCMASWDCCSSLGCSQQHLLNPTVFILITRTHMVRYTDMSWATLQLIGCCPAVTCMQHIHLATRFRTTGHYILSSARLHTSIKLLLCVLCLWHLGFAYCIRLLDMFVWLNATS